MEQMALDFLGFGVLIAVIGLAGGLPQIMILDIDCVIPVPQ
jgi:hypothetical protein